MPGRCRPSTIFQRNILIPSPKAYFSGKSVILALNDPLKATQKQVHHNENTENTIRPEQEAFFTGVAFRYLAAAVLLLFLILSLRGFMNAVNQTDFIIQRLDDYPRLYENYLRENDDWWSWWQEKDLEKRADLASFIFDTDSDSSTEEEKLAYVMDILGAEKALVVEASESPALESQFLDEGFSACSAHLEDGRRLVLAFRDSLKEQHMSAREDSRSFMSQLQAGLEGHVLMLHEGEFAVYPANEEGGQVREMILEMLSSGKLQPEALKAKAAANETGTALHILRNTKTTAVPARKYVLYTAAYADNDDFMINAVRTSDTVRLGRKRSWSLWFLCIALILLLGAALWRTRLYRPEDEVSLEGGPAPQSPQDPLNASAGKRNVENDLLLPAGIRGASAMILTAFLLFMSILFIQLLSGVNQSAQAASDEAVFLKNMLFEESARAVEIEEEFDSMYSKRLKAAAQGLSDRPELIELDSLAALCDDLGGEVLTIYDARGEVLASSRFPGKAGPGGSGTGEAVYTAVLQDEAGNSIGSLELKGVPQENDARIYQAPLLDERGKTAGMAELKVNAAQLEELLAATRMQDVIADMHLLDSMHIVAVETGKDHRITGCTKHWQNDLINFTTRGNVSLMPHGVCAHNGTKSGYDPDSYEDRLWLMKSVLSRTGTVDYSDKEWTSLKELVNGKDFEVNTVKRHIRMDFDMKRKPDRNSFEKRIVILDDETYEIANFTTNPFENIAEFREYRQRKSSVSCLRTLDDWNLFWFKTETKSTTAKPRDIEWAILFSCIIGHRAGFWTIPKLDELAGEQRCAWINQHNTSQKRFTTTDWKNAGRSKRQGNILPKNIIANKLLELKNDN